MNPLTLELVELGGRASDAIRYERFMLAWATDFDVHARLLWRMLWNDLTRPPETLLELIP